MSEASSLRLDAMVVAVPQQVSCEVGDETVILSMVDGTYFGLDPVAARIWVLLQERRTVAAIRDILLDEYEGVDDARCTAELVALLERLRAWKLIEVGDAADA